MDPTESLPAQRAPRTGLRKLAMLAVPIVVGTIPLAMMSSKLIGKSRETLTIEEQQYQLLLANAVAAGVDLHVDGLRARLSSVAHTLGAAIRQPGRTPRNEIQHALNDLTGARITHVRYTFLEGATVHAVSAGENPDSLEPLFEASLRQAADGHASSGHGATQAMLSDPFFLESSDHEAFLAVAAPVTSSGAFRGVLTAIIDFEQVWNAVTVRHQRRGHLLFAMDGRGQIFATSDVKQVAPGDDVDHWEIVQAYLVNPEHNAAQSIHFRTSPQEDGDVGTPSYVGAYELTGQGWGIFARARDDDMYWIVGDMERSTLFWALVTCGANALALLAFAWMLSIRGSPHLGRRRLLGTQ